MQYKRFTTTEKKTAVTFIPPEPPPIAKSVSTIEIGGNDVAITVVEPIRRARRYGAIFRFFLLTAALGVMLLPFTEKGKSALDLAASLLTAEDAVVRDRITRFSDILTARPDTHSASKSAEAYSPTPEKAADNSLLERFYAAAPMSLSVYGKHNSAKESALSGENAAPHPVEQALSNETAYTVDLAALSETPYPIPFLSDSASNSSADAVDVFGEAAPSVLIIHTHGTECYADADTATYRTDNPDKNVVSVGKVLAEALSAQGIEVLHCEEMFDKDSFITAYSRSYAAVKDYRTRYPSIRYVIDLHRDAVPTQDGYADLKTEIDGKECAKLMTVVGTDEAGAIHPNWQDNLRVAQEICRHVEAAYPSLMRSINLRRASFNQQLASGYFILEVGSCGGRLEAAQNSMPYFAKAFADTIKGQ